jgi:hypothetical protein
MSSPDESPQSGSAPRAGVLLPMPASRRYVSIAATTRVAAKVARRVRGFVTIAGVLIAYMFVWLVNSPEAAFA